MRCESGYQNDFVIIRLFSHRHVILKLVIKGYIDVSNTFIISKKWNSKCIEFAAKSPATFGEN